MRPGRGDSLWDKVNKAYERKAFPVLLIQDRGPASTPEQQVPQFDHKSRRKQWFKSSGEKK